MHRSLTPRPIAAGCTLVFLLIGGTPAAAHEIVGQVTPLMVHMKRALLLIENGKDRDAIAEARAVYEDFSHDMGMGIAMEGAGLKSTASQIDRAFGTQLATSIGRTLQTDDAATLRMLIQELAFLLMLEKFDAIQATLGKHSTNLDTQRTIFWLGRNYFSYLLEPTLATKDPIEEQRLDRMLDRMLYRLEDGEVAGFLDVRKDLVKGISTEFNLSAPRLISGGVAKG